MKSTVLAVRPGREPGCRAAARQERMCVGGRRTAASLRNHSRQLAPGKWGIE